jgi:hypothetical protein
MSPDTRRRVWAMFSIIASSIILVLAVLGILLSWLVSQAAIDVVVGLMNGVESASQTAQYAVSRIEARVADVRADVVDIGDSAAQLSGNVANEGLVVTLLPDEKVGRLGMAVSQVDDAAASLQDSVASARNLYRTMNRIPGVDLPALDETRLAAVPAAVDTIRDGAFEIKTGVQAVRQKQADAIARVTTAAGKVENRLDSFSSTLDQFNAGFVRLQDRAAQIRGVVPTLFTVIALLVILFEIWIIYTQVVVIRLALGQWRAANTAAQPAK